VIPPRSGVGPKKAKKAKVVPERSANVARQESVRSGPVAVETEGGEFPPLPPLPQRRSGRTDGTIIGGRGGAAPRGFPDRHVGGPGVSPAPPSRGMEEQVRPRGGRGRGRGGGTSSPLSSPSLARDWGHPFGRG